MGQLMYRMYQNPVKSSKSYGKWFARTVNTGTVGLEEIANTMQDNCTVKRADILAVLSELGPTVKQLLQNSKRVKIDYLGTFKLGMSTSGEAKRDDFSLNKNLKDIHVIFTPVSRQAKNGVRIKDWTDGCQLSELPNFDKAEGGDNQNNG